MTSAAALAQILLEQRPVAWAVAFPFVLGGLAGMFGGTHAARHIPALMLQRIFAASLIMVSCFMWYKLLHA